MGGLAQLLGQASTAPVLEWAVEVVTYSVLIIAGLALIFISALGQRRLKEAGGTTTMSFKDLFTLKTNMVGLFAVLGLVLIGGVLFLRFSDFQGQLQKAQQERLALQEDLEDERRHAREILEQFKQVSVEFALAFPEDAMPMDPDDVQVRAVVSSKDQAGLKEVSVVPQPGPGGIVASVHGLRAGDVIRLHASEGKRAWKSVGWEVPTVALRMVVDPDAQLAARDER